MVSFDADLHSKHENQVASAISLAVLKSLKFSAEAGMKKYAADCAMWRQWCGTSHYH